MTRVMAGDGIDCVDIQVSCNHFSHYEETSSEFGTTKSVSIGTGDGL